MRRLWLLPTLLPVVLVTMVLGFMALTPSGAQADNPPHKKGWGIDADCAACHRAHRGQAAALLVQDQAALCLSCHGAVGTSSLNVAGGSYDPGGALRGGGFETARIWTSDPSLSPSPRTIKAFPDKAGALAEAGIQCGNGVNDDPGDDAVIDDGCTGAVQSKHNVGTASTIWGYDKVGTGAGMAAFNLECGKCHDPHGSGNYRILRTVPSVGSGLGSRYPVPFTDTNANTRPDQGEEIWFVRMWNDLRPPVNLAEYGSAMCGSSGTGNGADDDGDFVNDDGCGWGIINSDETVWLADEDPKTYTTTDYWPVESYTDRWVDATSPADNVDTETTGRQVGKWCTTCHTRYLAPTDSGETSSGDAIFKYRHTTDASTRHTSSLNSPVTLSGSCLKCHVAHGTNATVNVMSPVGVTWPDGSASVNDGSDSRLMKMNLRGICQKCHNK